MKSLMKSLYESILDNEDNALDGSSLHNEKHRHYVVNDTRSDIEKYIDDNFFPIKYETSMLSDRIIINGKTIDCNTKRNLWMGSIGFSPYKETLSLALPDGYKWGDTWPNILLDENNIIADLTGCPDNLDEINIYKCPRLKSLKGLKKTNRLIINGCDIKSYKETFGNNIEKINITFNNSNTITDIECKDLLINGCNNLTKLNNIHTEYFNITTCSGIRTISGLDPSHIKKISLFNCDNLTNIDTNFKNANNLTEFYCGFTNLVSLPELPKKMEKLDVSNSPLLSLINCPEIITKSLTIHNTDITNFEGVSKEIKGDFIVNDCDNLNGYEGLENIHISGDFNVYKRHNKLRRAILKKIENFSVGGIIKI